MQIFINRACLQNTQFGCFMEEPREQSLEIKISQQCREHPVHCAPAFLVIPDLGNAPNRGGGSEEAARTAELSVQSAATELHAHPTAQQRPPVGPSSLL